MRERLQAALRDATLVSIQRRRFERYAERGYVVGLGHELFLLLLVSDEIWFNGFSVLRIGDVSEIEVPHRYSDFIERALRERGETVERAPEIELWNLFTALRSVREAFPLIALHQEELDSELCHVGAIVAVSGDGVDLLEIDPGAQWDDSPTRYPVDTITRLDFGGHYEAALALVGGSPPVKP